MTTDNSARTAASTATGASYATIANFGSDQTLDGDGKTIPNRGSGPHGVHVWESGGAQSIFARVIGSNDLDLAESLWPVVVAETSIALSTGVLLEIEIGTMLYYRLQVKNNSGAGAANAAWVRKEQ